VEDDFDSEFRYTGFPIASLQGLDTSGRVIYIGTFSKTVYPALRLGYLIPPPGLVGRFLDARRQIDHLAPTLEQATLTEFIEGGHFTRHVRRMRALYRERQEVLLEAAARELPGLLRVDAADTGMHALGWLQQRGAEDAAVARAARQQGIEAPPLSRYCLRAKLPPAILLGFAALQPRELQAGVRALRAVLRPSG
jgi:GntR family transcriptional regulator/MocR family aminotransferase